MIRIISYLTKFSFFFTGVFAGLLFFIYVKPNLLGHFMSELFKPLLTGLFVSCLFYWINIAIPAVNRRKNQGKIFKNAHDQFLIMIQQKSSLTPTETDFENAYNNLMDYHRADLAEQVNYFSLWCLHYANNDFVIKNQNLADRFRKLIGGLQIISAHLKISVSRVQTTTENNARRSFHDLHARNSEMRRLLTGICTEIDI